MEETRAKFVKSCIPIARSQDELDALVKKWDNFMKCELIAKRIELGRM